MYLAKGSYWAKLAKAAPNYKPPRLTDVSKLAEKKAQQGVHLYIGLSTEGLDESAGTYMAREDYSAYLIKQVKLFNDMKSQRFDWESFAVIPNGSDKP